MLIKTHNYNIWHHLSLITPAVLALTFSPITKANDDEDLGMAKLFKTYIPRFGGRLVYDYTIYQQDVTKLGNGSDLSSARLSMTGQADKDWRYKIEYDFSGNGSIKNAWLGYWPKENYRIQIGNLLEPISMEETTSSRNIIFIERALPNIFAPSYHLGTILKKWSSRTSYSVGMFADTANADPANEGNEGYGMSGRITHAPVKFAKKIFHFGASAAIRHPDEKAIVRFRARPESDLTNVRFVDTGKIKNVNRYMTLGIEAAALINSLTLQAEIINTNVSRRHGAGSTNFSGGYTQLSWLFNGLKRSYKHNGTFGSVNMSDNDSGAWELGLRYSFLDLNSGDINGGEEKNITFGVNYYINPDLRWMVNCILIDTHKNNVTETPSAIALRMQANF